MTVNVTDGADPPLDGWCTFRVEIEDINDNRPQFDRTDYTADITSDTQQNQVILAVRAYDSDIGMNGEIEYSLLDNAGIFSVYPANGFIYLSDSLVGVSDNFFSPTLLQWTSDPQSSSLADVTYHLCGMSYNLCFCFEV